MKGKAIFIMGPTGIGKSTTVRLLRKRNPEFIYLPSYTDRAMRTGEKQGDPYFFISQQQFQDKIKNNDFLEYAFVHNLDYKGTNKQEIYDAIEDEKIIYKEVELKGYFQIEKNLQKEMYTTIFLYPTDPEIIKARILELVTYEKYKGFGPTFMNEKLLELHSTDVSIETASASR